MANQSFSYEEAFGPSQDSSSVKPGGNSFSYEEAFGQPAPAEPGFIPTIKRTGGQMLTTAATAAEDVVGSNAVTRAVHDAGQGIIDRNPAGIRSLRDLVDSPWLAVKESVGQFAPQIAAAAVGGVAGAKAGAALGSIAGPAGAAAGGTIGGVAGSLLPIFTQEYGGIRQEQKESGQEDKARALAAAGAASALERVGMGKALNVLKGVPGGTAGTVLKEAGKGVLKEGATEGAQNVIEQWGAFKDPTTAESLEDTALSAAMGGIGGGVMGGGAGAVDGARRRAQERAEAQTLQRTEDAIASAEALTEEARRADPTSGWTTAAGAADPATSASTGLPDVSTYGLMINQVAEPAQQERLRNLLDSATNVRLSQEQRAAAADELHAIFSPEQLERDRALQAGTDFTTAPGAAAPREGGMDFTRDADTSGLSLEDPAEVERARAATIDYEQALATPQWDTAAGAAPARQPGLDMPAPEFDTAGMALDERPPSQRMGLDPAAGPMSRYAAQAVDTAAAQEAQFIAATGRDPQVQRGAPGMTDQSNVIDVQGRVVEDPSFLFHHAEKFNRQVTFVAAYRLAREAGAESKQAYQQAVQATYDGHFDYSANNRPRVMQGNVARVVLLFKQYSQNMVYTLVRNAQQSLKGASPEERAQARKALGGLLVMHGLAAGALGLPMVTTLLAAASMLGGDDDEPWDAEVALRNMLADTFGQKPAEVLAHGLSRLTPWDISGRVGLDKLIFPDVQEGLEGQRLGESAMTAALGPVAGIGINLLKGVQEMSEGRYARGLEAMAPSVLRGPLKAWRYETEGVKDKTGIVVQDEVDAAALWGQAAGFSPSSVRNAYEGKAAIVGHDRALMARRSALVEQFAMAAMAGDELGKAEAREAVARFNEKNPSRRILPMQLAQSVAARQKRIREAQEGVYLPSKRRDAVEQGRFAAGG